MKGIMKREYRNPFMLSRISGTMFDLMVVASIAAINLSAFRRKEFVLPLIILTALGGLVTFFYLKAITNKLYPTYRDEAFISLYGMLTGTASTGVILLREIDPNFETPASDNLIYQQLWAILFGFPMLLLLGLSPKSLGMTILTLALLAVLFVAMNVILFRKNIFKGKKK
jgi:ESS family glutamate:Na+ symporter